MARLTLIFTVIVFLFSVTHARLPADSPVNDVITADPTITLPESDAEPLIKLPSEKSTDDFVSESQTGFATVSESESRSEESAEVTPVNESESESKSDESVELSPVSEISSENENTRSVTVVLRPIHHHFNRFDKKSRFGFGFRSRHHHSNGDGQRTRKHEFSFGDDMIMPSEKMESEADHNAARSIRFHVKPMHDMRFGHRHGHDFVISEEDEHMRHHFHHRHHHHRHHEEEEHERREDGGLLKKIRKFLNDF